MIEHPTLYIVRYAETEAQAEEVARYLNYTELGIVVSANTPKCLDTAAKLTTEVMVDDRLEPFKEANETPEQFVTRMEAAIDSYTECETTPVVVITDALNIATLTPLKVEAGGILAIHQRTNGRDFTVLL
jgi:hypothetical protein